MRIKITNNLYSEGGTTKEPVQKNNWRTYNGSSNKGFANFNGKIKPVKREKSNLEAEKGETVQTNIGDTSGIPELYKIGGKRHSQGGTPLNVPEGSFFFSDTAELKIKDKKVLEMFDITDGKSHTPADISKKYDLNKYKKILADPYATKMEKHTAELMIKKCNEKLGKLALIQESMKGFPDGLPDIAQPYVMNSRVDLNKVFQSNIQEQPEPQLTNNAAEEDMEEQAKKGGQKKSKVRIKFIPKLAGGGMGDAYTRTYTMLYDLLKDEKTRKALVDKMRENIKSVKPGKGLTQDDIDRVKNMTDEQLINNYLYGTKRVFTFNNNNSITADWDKDSSAHNKAAKELGLKEFTPAQTAAFQLGYQSIADLANTDEYKDKFKDFDLATTGPKHEGYTGAKTNISPVDGYWGDNTANQGVRLKKEGEGEGKDSDKKGIDAKHLDGEKKEDDAPFMTNDMINLWGAIGDRDKLHQYTPWSAPINNNSVAPSFTDFRGDAARANSGYKSALAAQAQFSGPQSVAALANSASVDLANQLGQITEQEQKANINISNNFALQNAKTKEAVDTANAQRKTQDYNNWVAMKDDFNTEKLKYKQNIRNALTTAINNRGMLQAMNSLNDNYKFDQNGILHFTPDGRKINPSTPSDPKADFIKNLNYLKGQGLSGDDLWKGMEILYGRQDEAYDRERDKKDDKDYQTQLALENNPFNNINN